MHKKQTLRRETAWEDIEWNPLGVSSQQFGLCSGHAAHAQVGYVVNGERAGTKPDAV